MFRYLTSLILQHVAPGVSAMMICSACELYAALKCEGDFTKIIEASFKSSPIEVY